MGPDVAPREKRGPAENNKKITSIQRRTSQALILLALTSPNAHAKLACQTDNDCITKFGFETTKCLPDGFCDNPYQYGCLTARKPEAMKHTPKMRVCHSEDPPDAASKELCRDPNSHGMDYPEVRIMSQNWESPFFESWILQILLSEVMDVPTTIETGVAGKNVNFYDPQGRFDYGISYDMEALAVAASDELMGDCSSIQAANQELNNSEDYRGCGHAILEIWSGQEDVMADMVERQAVEPEAFIGIVGQEGWFLPKYTAMKDPTLTSHFGLSGEQNRRKLAERFLRPTTWGVYCELFDCTNIDNSTVAVRSPLNEEESKRYFVDNLYHGHFRKTDENDCDKNPFTCTGHFLDYPCGWTSFFIQQAHHLNIALKANGDEPGSHGYTYNEMVDIWSAANYTKSDIIGWWWRPESLYQSFQNTDFELQPVLFPPTNHDCVANRAPERVRCGDNDTERVGNAIGTCDVPPVTLYKLISTGLYKSVYRPEISVGRRSPAHDALKEFTVDGFQLGQIFQYWLEPNVDQYGFDARDAVCRWVSENYEELTQRYVPRTYPRVVRDEKETVGNKMAITMGTVAFALTLFVVFMTYRQRKRKVFQYAQIEFVYLLLFGLLLVSTAAVLTAIPPTDHRCLATVWLLNVGYSFELVPLVVKIAAINRLMQAARRLQRIQLSRGLLFGGVAMLTGAVVIFMLFWTILDPPTREGHYTLTESEAKDGKTIVTVAYLCESGSEAWMIVSVGFQALLLLCASILAFLTRKGRKDINDSTTISRLIYLNFIWVLLRFILLLLGDTIDVSRVNRSLSMILSADSIVTVLIYFVPKFMDKNNSGRSSVQTTHNFVSVGVPEFWQSEDEEHHGPSSFYTESFRNRTPDNTNRSPDPDSDPDEVVEAQEQRRRSSGYDSEEHGTSQEACRTKPLQVKFVSTASC